MLRCLTFNKQIQNLTKIPSGKLSSETLTKMIVKMRKIKYISVPKNIDFKYSIEFCILSILDVLMRDIFVSG